MKRTIIAFTGLAGAGKSTAAAHLVKSHGFERVRFAGPLKAMMAALGCSTTEIDGDRKELPCELLGGKTPRWAMQTLGTEWGRQLIDSDLWIRAWRTAVDASPVSVVVDDCRFPNEAEAIRAAGGVLVRIERPGAGTASKHESEQHELPAITTISNAGSERELFEKLDRFLLDFSWCDSAP
ncbi:deoxynucleotide monophosphate kinase [Bradyrhizobium sp. HKCCYLS2038]|uniref:deoxynucleotide monophosphate kinase family protein n=1 Tax=Bradyrhizobium sp. HKCCYLS2038 TaxID=3420764 RepID=UPI003EBA7F69